MKIIHIVENLDKGAVENWLVRTFIESKSNFPNWEWTFFCILGKEGKLDEIVRKNGGVIIYSPVTISKKLSFLKFLRGVLKSGNYDILHFHHDFLSGFISLSAIGIPFHKKILHIHNNDGALPVGNKILHNLLLPIFRFIGIFFNDTIIGISNYTLNHFIQPLKWLKRDYRVLYYGVNFDDFDRLEDSYIIRSNLGIPISAKIILFAGRMNSFKNPIMAFSIMKYLIESNENIFGLFIGQGNLIQELTLLIAENNLTEKIKILGWRDDLIDIMKASDLFLFPRLEYPKEGLGLVIIEAQAVGVPVLASNAIVDDAIIIQSGVVRIPINLGIKKWADTAYYMLEKPKSIYYDSLTKMKKSAFNLPLATQNLVEIYISSQ